MEEVDKIVIHSLNVIGCDLDEDIQSLRQFSTELIVSSAIRCLKVINNEVDLPNSLPSGMSARFRTGTSLASIIQELGYKGEIGYQTFLYSNETEIRKVFMFLIDKLPKDKVETEEEPLGASALLQRTISASVARYLDSPWVPPYLKSKNITWRGKPPVWQKEVPDIIKFVFITLCFNISFLGALSACKYHSCHVRSPHGMGDLTKKISKEVRSYYSESLPYVTNQTIHHCDTAPSVMEDLASELTAQQEWENEWNTIGLPSRLSEQEYRARKRQRIQKRLKDNLRSDVQRSGDLTSSKSAMDLQQMIDAMGNRSSGSAKTKGSRFTHTEQLIYGKDEEKTLSQIQKPDIDKGHTEEELQKEREEDIENIKTEYNNLISKIDNLELESKKLTASMKQMEDQIQETTLDLLPDAENNITKIQSVVDSSAQRLVTLANQWEKHRAPLIEQYRELKDLNSKKESEAEKKLEEIKAFRSKMKEVADDARQKEELQKQLIAEYERMTKDVNRSAYTKRIMEIVSNIKKQKTALTRY
ncbi:CCDC22 [Mytilus edulis]|uniref:CCDC22 n=1 Tax=Mytilus edulis TaxID=6550 RepID=A0A8S3SL74_MYTED|nr:CCDC22 [Mytilus edulis]